MIVLSELKTELETDPAVLGYTGDDATDAAILNVKRASIQLERDAIPTYEVLGQVDWDGEWAALTDAQRHAFGIMTSTESIDARSQNIRDAFLFIFGAPSNTITALQGIITRDGSRGEELWGIHTVVTPSHCADARRL